MMDNWFEDGKQLTVPVAAPIVKREAGTTGSVGFSSPYGEGDLKTKVELGDLEK